LLTAPTQGPEDEIARYLSHFPSARSTGFSRNGDGIPAKAGTTSAVCIVGDAAGTKLLAQAIGEHGIDASCTHHAEPDECVGGQLTVCAWEQLDAKLVSQVNEAACREGRPCLFVDLSHGCHATIGPFYVPGESSCYECYRQRWRQNTAALAEADAAWDAARQRPAAPHGTLPAFRYQVAGVAAGEVFAFFSRHRPLRTLNRAVTVDFEALQMWSEPVWRIPWCQSCGARE